VYGQPYRGFESLALRIQTWRGDRAAEGARLEIVCTLNGTEGSNPSLSAGPSSSRRQTKSMKFMSRAMTCKHADQHELVVTANTSRRGVVVPPTQTR
jgi:hypothetical protein